MSMKRIREFGPRGIRGKVIGLIVFAVVLVTAAFMALSTYRSNELSRLVTESGKKQQSSIAETTSLVMDEVVEQTLLRSNRTEARIADDMFGTVKDRVTFLADYATKLFAHPENYRRRSYQGPDPADDGKWTMKVIYAEGVDQRDPQLVSKIGLLADMSDIMISLCSSFDAETMYIALPEGVHISVSQNSSGWFIDGEVRDYDPRERGWYQKAVREGKLIFSEGERDAVTGVYCIECAMPVYGPDGTLQAVIGADLFLDEMEEVMSETVVEGEYILLVNKNGHAVLVPQGEAFPMEEGDRGKDLRHSELNLLSHAVSDALEGKMTGVVAGSLADGMYYVTASPIRTTGWVLVSAYSQEISGKSAIMLQKSLNEIQADTTNVYHEKMHNSRVFAFAVLSLISIAILAGALILGTMLVKPLNTITKRVSELNEENLQFKMEDEYRTGDEVEELATAFATISEKTVQYMDQLVKVTAEKERIGAELSLATDIQSTMLPHIFPAFPNRTEFDIYASMDPAKEVGGDFYDYFLVDDDHLAMVMADVSGKGVPAALFMMASKIILQSVAMLGNEPAEILNKTNEAICSNNDAEMFVTVWMGILELSTGKLTAANAGHEYPVIKRPDGNFEIYKDRHGLVLGAMAQSKYKQYELLIEPGTKLFFYTDGVPEANNADKEAFGMDRMVEALNADPNVSPQQILQNVRKAVDAFTEEAEQFDDLTMMCLEYIGTSSKE